MKKKCDFTIRGTSRVVQKISRRMKALVFMLLCAGLTSVSARTSAQVQLDLKVNNKALSEVFREITRHTGYKFLYSSTELRSAGKVSLDVKDADLEEVMATCLQGTGLWFRIEEQTVIVSPKFKAPEAVEGTVLTGVVTDKTGAPLPGVTVLVKGTSVGVSTDMDGKFTLKIPEPQKVILLFSMVGMRTKEVLVGGKTDFKVVMEEEASDLDEVVIIGYGSAKKKDLTGSVERFDSKILEESAATNVADMMQGQIAGLSILSGSGAPGEGARLEIRGVPSLSGATTPLIVVDNVPMAPEFDINELNPGDIESIDVLKGASAAAIYGSRGAAGVIIVTLKQGRRDQKPVVNYSFSYSVSSLASGINTLTTDEFKVLLMEATINEARAAGESDITKYSFYKTITQPGYFGEENTPWMKYLMRNGTMQQHRVSLRGGGENFNYNASFGYNSEDGQLKSLYFDRYTYTMNFNADLNKWLRAGMNVSGTLSDRRSNNTFKLSDAMNARPDIKAYNEDGTLYLHSYLYGNQISYAKNPIIELTENGKKTEGNNLNLSGNLEFKILPSLTLRTQYAFASRRSEEDDFASSRTQTGSNNWKGQAGAGSKRHSKYKKNEFEAQLTYNSTLGKSKDHSLQAVGVVSYWDEETTYYTLKRVDYADDNVQNGIWQGTNKPSFGSDMSGSAYGSKMISYVARGNYSFKGRYLLTASVRADGSSKFAPSNRWGVFPAVAAGWLVSEEKFMKTSNSWLPYLKVRLEWGITGNGWVGEYGWRTLFDNTKYEQQPAIIPSQVGNDQLKWEQTKQYDVALDFGFLKNNRLNGTLGFYLKKTDGLLYSFTMAPSTGLYSTKTNFANIENKGVEFRLNADIIRHKDWRWSFGFNINKNLNKITNIDAEFVSQPGYAYLSNTVIQEGKSLGLIYGFQTDGTFYDQAEVDYYESLNEDYAYQEQYSYRKTIPGDLKFVDQNGDGRVNVASGNYDDKVVLGCSRPKFEGGFNTRLGWKGLTLSVQATYSYGAKKVWGARDKQFSFAKSNPNNLLDFAMKRWTPNNRDSKYPCVRLDHYANYFSDFNVCKASFLKIQNINLSYQLPKIWMERTKVLSRADVFVSATNPFVFTPYPGPSPESYSGNVISGASVDTEAYPRTWTFNVGLNITF